MATQMLIYENVVPITTSRHANWSVEVTDDLSFAKNLNSVPIVAVEFPLAAHEYPIVFSKGQDETIQPVVILGMRGQENLYLGSDNRWQAKYVPAFLRRYPFVFSLSSDGQTFSLSIDEKFPGFNQKGKGQALLAKDGKPTAYVNNVMAFMQDYQAQFVRTQALCKKLDELDLLEPQTATWTAPNGEQTALTGFLCINRDKLKTLNPKMLAGMVASDEMELIYLHLYSLSNFGDIKDRLLARPAATTAAATASVPKK
jgi:hypothetical protein